MAANPRTDQLLATLRNVLAKAPGGEIEETLVSETIRTARAGLPDISQADLGEVMMHLVPIFTALADRACEFDPTLTFQQRERVALNVLAVAGARMHVGARR